MVAALRGFGSDGAAVVGGSDDIVPVAVGSGSEGTPFPGLVERSERAMSILWRGADLGTQAHAGSGQGQGASLQGDETAALDADRAAWLSESLASVSRTAIKYLFGEGVQPLAYVRLKTQVARDIQLDLAVDTFLLSNGAPVGVADVLARYSRPTPGADEPLLRPPGGAGDGDGGAKGAASEEATLASIERAANGAMASLVADNGGGDPYHDALGRFTNAEGAVAPSNKGAPQSSTLNRPAASMLSLVASTPESEGTGWGLHQPDFWDKVGGIIYPGYMAAKRHKAWLLKKYGAKALSREVLQAMPQLATEEYMRAYEQLGDKVDDPQALQELQDRYVAQMNGALRLHTDVARTEKTIAKPALDAIEMMATAGVTEGLAALDAPALRASLRSNPEPPAFTRSLETREPIPTSVPEAPAQPAEPAAGGTTATSGKATSELSDALSSLGGNPREGVAELYSRTKGKPMDRADYTRIKADFERRPGYLIFDTKDVIPELDRIGRNIGGRVEGWTVYKNIIFLRPGASRSAVFEELIHAAQLERGMDRETQWIQMEIEAKQELIKFQKQYGISDAENAETIQQLKHYTDLQAKQQQR